MAAALAAAAAGEAPSGSAADEQYGREMWARCEALTSGGEAFLLTWAPEHARAGLMLRCFLQIVSKANYCCNPKTLNLSQNLAKEVCTVSSMKCMRVQSACGLDFGVRGSTVQRK